uniref:hypothetical protein n=1 Tax=Prevotella sp. TaxID=59823 RepID=UPI004024FD71
MATKKVYPFIVARIAEDDETLEGNEIMFDAREVAYYHGQAESYDDMDNGTGGYKSGMEIKMYLGFGADISYENLVLAINKVQCSHFWHDNEDSTPDGYKGED